MAICLGASFNANAQSILAKQKAKQQKKEYKQKVREYDKGGWQILGSSHTLEMALLNHYEAMEKGDVIEISGFAKSQSKNIASAELRQRAAEAYAHECGGFLKGRVTDEMGSSLNAEQLEELENFYAAYENNVQKEINGELRASYSVYRQTNLNGKKVFEFEGLYLINEDAAAAARQKAMQNSFKESKLAQEHAKEISEFINEPFAE